MAGDRFEEQGAVRVLERASPTGNEVQQLMAVTNREHKQRAAEAVTLATKKKHALQDITDYKINMAKGNKATETLFWRAQSL